MSVWSQELAQRVESDLTKILSPIPTVTEIRGSSYAGYRDFKVVFHHSRYGRPYAFFLELKPHSEMLEAWAGGLPDPFPDDVRDYITKAFPNAEYRQEKGIGVDGFHQWHHVTEMDIRRAVAAGTPG